MLLSLRMGKVGDKRQIILDLLGAYRPVDEQDQNQAHQITEFIQSHPDCFERSHSQGHITGSAWVVDESHRKVFLTHHKKLNKWLQLGGHADGNPDILSVALREAKEESGLENIRALPIGIFDVDIHLIPPISQEPAHFHYDIRFAFEALGSQNPKASAESHQVAWIDLERLSDVTSEEALQRMNRKWKEWLQNPKAINFP